MGVDPAVLRSEAALIFRGHGVKPTLFGSRARRRCERGRRLGHRRVFRQGASVLDEAELAVELSRVLGIDVDVIALDSAPLDLI